MHARLQEDNYYMKMKKISTIILAAAVSASVILPGATALAYNENGEPETFEELYGNQLVNYLNHQYYFDGEAIPVNESNFYFINSFLELGNYANMGYTPATTLNYLDLAAEYPGDGYGTWGDYFVEYAENSLEMSCILCKRAAEEGVKLSDDTLADIDSLMESMKTGNAASANMTLDEYLQFYYGPGNDEVNFRKVVEKYYLTDAYSKKYCEDYVYSDEQKNPPYIRYALFYAPESADQTTKDTALADATAMKDACTGIDSLTDLIDTAYADGKLYDQGGDVVLFKGQITPEAEEFEAWAYDSSRKKGDIDVVYDPEWGYYVVGYLGTQEQISFVPNIRYALFYAPETDDQTNKDNALKAAQAMKDACSSINDLTGLAKTAYENGTVRDQGDILVPKGQMVAKFEEWAYGEGRTEGEMDIIYAPEYGYFVVGYLGIEKSITDSLKQIALKELSDSILEEINAKSHDFHTDETYGPAPAAPTATPVPDEAIPTGPDFNPYPTDPTDASGNPTGQNMSTADVLVVVFITLAGVAIAAVIVILIMYAVKNNKNGGNTSSGKSDGKKNDFGKGKNDKSEKSEKKAPAKKKASRDEDEDDEDEDFIGGSDDDDSDAWKKPGKDSDDDDSDPDDADSEDSDPDDEE